LLGIYFLLSIDIFRHQIGRLGDIAVSVIAFGPNERWFKPGRFDDFEDYKNP